MPPRPDDSGRGGRRVGLRAAAGRRPGHLRRGGDARHDGLPAARRPARGCPGVPGLRLVESDYRLEWADHPWEDVARAASWLLELEAQAQPDIVHLNGYAHGGLAWSAPAVVVAHSCVCSWWTAVRGGDASGEWDAYRCAVRDGLRAATAVVAPSAAMLRALSAHYGAVAGTVVPNGRDAAQFGTGPKEPLVLGAGRLWDEAKNVTALASVAHRLPWRVALAGETQDCAGDARRMDIRRVSRAPVVGGSARVDGPRVHLRHAGALRALSACRFSRRGSRDARWCSATSRACASTGRAPRCSSRPTIGTRCTSAIARLIDNPARRAELGRRARVRGQEFTVARMADAYRRLYEGLLVPSERRALEVSSCAS